MSHFDDIFKERLKQSFFILLKEAFNETFEEVQSKPIELRKQIKRKADFIFRVKQNEQDMIMHLEIQAKDDMQMLERMHQYSALLRMKYGKIPIKQVVLFLGRDKNIKSKMPFEANFGYYTYRYKLINIANISYTTFLKHKDTLIFAILGNFNGKRSVEVVKEILSKTEEFFTGKEETEEFLKDLLILSDLRSLEEEVRNYIPKFMPLDIDITQTITYKEVLLRGKLEGELKVAKKMLLKGRSISEVQEFTDLTIEQIVALKNELNIQ